MPARRLEASFQDRAVLRCCTALHISALQSSQGIVLVHTLPHAHSLSTNAVMLRRGGMQGDCGLMQVRQDGIVFRTKPMSHQFDCPLQLAAAPEFSDVTDHASNAFNAQLRVQPGDLLVAGSDGLWDNLHANEVLAILRRHPHDAERVSYSDSKLTCR